MQPASAPDAPNTPANQPASQSASPSTGRVFKPKSTYTYTLPNGKKARVRFPTDDEWCARQRAVIDVTRTVGRQRTKTDSKGEEEANLALFNAIRIAKDGETIDEFDAYEAASIIQLISERSITEVRRIGDNFQVTLNVPGDIDVVHLLRSPSMRQVRDYYKVAIDRAQGRLGSETRVMLEPSGGLWDKLVVDVTGYADNISTGVPIIHKDASLTELLLQINAEIQGGPDPED